VNRSKRSALRAESRDPIAARTMIPIPPRDLHGVRRLVSLRAGFERLHLQGTKARRLQRAFRLRPGCGACCPAEPGPEGHADARRRENAPAGLPTYAQPPRFPPASHPQQQAPHPLTHSSLKAPSSLRALVPSSLDPSPQIMPSAPAHPETRTPGTVKLCESRGRAAGWPKRIIQRAKPSPMSLFYAEDLSLSRPAAGTYLCAPSRPNSSTC